MIDEQVQFAIFRERLGYTKVADIPDRLRRDDCYVSATLFSKISALQKCIMLNA